MQQKVKMLTSWPESKEHTRRGQRPHNPLQGHTLNDLASHETLPLEDSPHPQSTTRWTKPLACGPVGDVQYPKYSKILLF